MKKYRLTKGGPADKAVTGAKRIGQAVLAGSLLWWAFIAYGMGWL